MSDETTSKAAVDESMMKAPETPFEAALHRAFDDDERADLDRRFLYHAPKGDQPQRYDEIRAEARRLAHRILVLCPDSRERSVALTRLEESVMWANASIARNE